MKKTIIAFVAIALFFSGFALANNMTDSSSGGSVADSSAMQMVGNDSDAHGCIGSAGYSWCESLQKCLRTWEEPCPALYADSAVTSTSGANAAVACVNAPMTSDNLEKCKSEGMLVRKKMENGCVVGFECVKPSVIASSVSVATSEQVRSAICQNQNYDAIKKKCSDNNMQLVKKVSESGCIELACAETATKAVAAESCVDENLNSELNSLFMKLNDAEQNGDNVSIPRIKERIENVSRKMNAINERCQVLKPVEAAATSSSGGAGVSAAVKKIEACNDIEAFKKKISYLEDLLKSTDILSQSGITAEDATAKLSELRTMLEERMRNCNNLTKTNLGVLVSQAVKNKEGGASDIVAYYKMRLSDAISNSSDPAAQISGLKQLRNEIDRMISELINKNQRISSEDMSPIVSEMTVRPNEIVADSVSVEGTNKTIDVNVNGSDAEVQTTTAGVSLNSGNDTATARELKLENNTVRVGNSTIRILPSRVVEIIKISPKAMEIVEENNMVIYKVKADEDRKLLGIFAVKMEKQIDVDGSQGNIVSETLPWWVFLTTAAK